MRRLFHLSLAIALFLLFEAALFIAKYNFFDLRSLDGAFQSLALVQAVEAGRTLGVDFFPYLGPLMAYLLYVPYVLFGGDIFAITASSYLISALGAAVTILVLAWLSGVSPAASLLAATAVLALLWKFPVGIAFSDLHTPGNSLRSVRWAWPYAIALLIWSAHAGLRSTRVSASLRSYGLLATWGAAAGLSLFWSPDAGVSSFLALAVVWPFLDFASHRGLVLIARWTLMLLIAVATTFLVGQAISGGHLGSWFHYLFVGLPSEQFWFFGFWEEFRRVYDLDDVFRNVLAGLRGSLVIPTALMALRLLFTLPSDVDVRLMRALLAFASLGACATAVLPQIGGVVDDRYALPVVPAFVFLVVISFRELVLRRRHWPMPALSRVMARVPAGVLDLGKLMIFTIPVVLMAIQTGKLVLRDPEQTAYVPEFGLRVPVEEHRYFPPLRRFGEAADAAGLAPDERIFPIYLSANEVLAGATLPSPYGMTIHALGPRARAEHLAAFRARTYPLVTTINPTYDRFAKWNLRSSWYLFREIISRYRPFAKSKQHIFWVPRTTPLPDPHEMTCRTEPVMEDELDVWARPESRLGLSVTGADGIDVPRVYAEIEVEVTVERAPSILPLLGDRKLITVREAASALGEDEMLHWLRGPVQEAFWWRILGSGEGDVAPGVGRRYGVGGGSGTLLLVAPHQVGTVTRLVLESRPSDRTEISARRCSARAVFGYLDVEEIPGLTEDTVIPLIDPAEEED